ncbi:MAG: CBM20 domain-containing protein [Nostoc sp. DcaGUA01]|nr:CBM20 domain-containing protein [Nostoc sp. DcaGUA01]
MYRFQISAYTQTGEFIGIVGSTTKLGLWDIKKCLHLHTSPDRYPLWWTDTEINFLESGDQTVEYKYIRIDSNGSVRWEAFGPNRWLPIDPEDQSKTIVVDDGAFSYLQPYSFGYFTEEPAVRMPKNEDSDKLKIAVIGSSVALGHKAWP